MTDQIEFSESITTPMGVPPTSSVELECGCVYAAEGDGPVYVVRQCAEHDAKSAQVEREIASVLGYELDTLVTEACRGRKLERVRPVDPYQVKR